MINSSREQHGMRSTPGKTAGAVGFESASAPMVETRLGEDAPPRIPRAEEKDVIGLAGHKAVPKRCSRMERNRRQPGQAQLQLVQVRRARARPLSSAAPRSR